MDRDNDKEDLTMKKLFTFALALVLVLSLSVTAFAADTTIDQDTTDKTGSTTVEFSVAPTYTVTIPATVELSKTGTGTITYEQDADITASAGVRLLKGQQIQVTLVSDFNLETAADTTYQLPYTVKVGDSATAIVSGAVVAAFGTSTEAQTSTLHFAADNPTYAGDYSDTVIFTISVVNA